MHTVPKVQLRSRNVCRSSSIGSPFAIARPAVSERRIETQGKKRREDCTQKVNACAPAWFDRSADDFAINRIGSDAVTKELGGDRRAHAKHFPRRRGAPVSVRSCFERSSAGDFDRTLGGQIRLVRRMILPLRHVLAAIAEPPFSNA
jgi:hypothetical protein